MSLTSLMNQPGTIRRRTPGTPDAEGNPTFTTADTETIGRREDQATDDHTDRRSSRSLLYLGPDEEIDGGDQWLQDGRAFEVEGRPYMATTPRGPHHWEVTLREVTP